MTTRGATVLGSGLGFLLAWVILGEIELLAAGAAMLVGVVVALLVVGGVQARVEISRQLQPSFVHEGERASVGLHIENQRRFPVFGVTVEDGVNGLGTARFQMGTLPAAATATAGYQIVCRPRGVYQVGPAVVEVRDPLGLASRLNRVGVTDRLIVYPAVEALQGFPQVRGRDPAQSASRPEHNRQGGEDFYTLRAYQEGDDLRRVHWPSSARLDELMLRQMETPWQSRALVFFDVRRKSYDGPEAFERAVRGAASVAVHLASGFDTDLWLGGAVLDLANRAMAFEELALIQPLPAIDLRAVATRLRLAGKGGALALVTGTPDDELLSVVRLLSDQYRVGVLLSASDDPGNTISGFQRLSVQTVVTGRGETWAPAWSRVIEGGGARTWASASA